MHTTMTVNKKTTYLRLVMQVFALLLLTMPFIALPDVQPAYAQPAAPPAGPPAGPPSGPPASPTAPRRTTLVNPLGTSSISILVGRAINGFLALSGSFALLMFVYGSFTWVTSGGSTVGRLLRMSSFVVGKIGHLARLLRPV